MNAVIVQQTAIHLARHTRRWDRRLRLVMSAIWLPRGLFAGLMIGNAMAIISRLQPWLLPGQIAFGAVVAVIVCGLATLAAVWGWPRSEAHNARFFDLLFDLKERVSTALELTDGLIPMPETLAERQLSDAVDAAGTVEVRERLPFQVRVWEWVAVLALGGLLIYLLMADNPMADKIRSQRELDSAINQQIQDLEQTIDEIEANENLTPEERDALTQPLQDAQNILRQSDISQQEAVAAMAAASDQLEQMTDGMSNEDESSYQNAAQNLKQSQMTSDLAQAFQKPDLSEAGDAMDDMANKMNEERLSQQQREDMADRLEQAADAMEQTNPALAEKMRETAEALRRGDMEAAEKAAREAGELLREQEQALENSPSAQAAQEAQQQVNESQRELAQAGQEGEQEQSSQQNQDGEQQGQQQGSQQEDQAQTAAGAQQGQQSGQEGGQPQPGEGVSQTGDAAEGEGESEGQSLAGESGQAGQPSGQSEGEAQSSQDQSGGGAEAGEGEGGAGSDNIEGVTGQEGPGETTSDNTVGGGVQEFQPEFESSTIGGENTDTVDVGGNEPQGDQGDTIGQGEFGPNPEGESTLSYTGVYNEYRDIVSNALESGRIPLDQRDVIHDYFSSLDQ